MFINMQIDIGPDDSSNSLAAVVSELKEHGYWIRSKSSDVKKAWAFDDGGVLLTEAGPGHFPQCKLVTFEELVYMRENAVEYTHCNSCGYQNTTSSDDCHSCGSLDTTKNTCSTKEWESGNA